MIPQEGIKTPYRNHEAWMAKLQILIPPKQAKNIAPTSSWHDAQVLVTILRILCWRCDTCQIWTQIPSLTKMGRLVLWFNFARVYQRQVYSSDVWEARGATHWKCRRRGSSVFGWQGPGPAMQHNLGLKAWKRVLWDLKPTAKLESRDRELQVHSRCRMLWEAERSRNSQIFSKLKVLQINQASANLTSPKRYTWYWGSQPETCMLDSSSGRAASALLRLDW